ncbi:hypothetical protein BO78DRAFT_395867 [Aspergillus sclerotiicarbonarius CBS 121057]|uniref:Uncharacterized protein n=1 Tax=Aspergillus sclerotiicarbonarius (strain CBS 121057 / IBT 28362) TaxID=1448318 RepID=A0A319EDK2_ASPSB|nr:hypothetical protein BO78DRAFT_395867 [Aspergillus sclerotiicarbonarius CBS 121057]
MSAACLRRWPLSRSGHCVIDPVAPWASISSSFPTTLLPRLSSAQLQPIRITPTQHSHYHHLCPSQPHLHNNLSILSTTTRPTHITPLPTFTTTRTMSSDDAYMSFLNKANADLTAGQSQPATTSSSSARIETIHTDVRIPAPLTSVDAFYISETDEPFEPVALKWDGAARGIWPDASHLSNLISPDKDLTADIETLSPSTFDPQNQYAGVLRAVRASAGDEQAADVKVYRVEVGRSRVEYFVLALDGQGGLLVGLRAKAIES